MVVLQKNGTILFIEESLPDPRANNLSSDIFACIQRLGEILLYFMRVFVLWNILLYERYSGIPSPRTLNKSISRLVNPDTTVPAVRLPKKATCLLVFIHNIYKLVMNFV